MSLISRSSFLLFFFLLAFISVNYQLGAEEFSPQNLGNTKVLFVVDDIVIDGLKKVEKEAVLEKLKIKPGSELTNYKLRDALKRVYSMNHFEHVKAQKRVVNGKTSLVFKVIEKPIIAEIKLKGNVDIDEDKILEAIKTKQYSIIDINGLSSDVKAIEKLYEEKGYYLASISYKIEKISDETVRVKFEIDESQQVKVKKITFLGNQAFSDGELKSILETREDSLFSFMSGGGTFKEDSFEIDVERLKYFYATKGYLQINVQAPEVTISEDKKWVFITMRVNEGPQFTVNDISFQGELLFSYDELYQKISLKKEKIYSESLLREDIQNLTELYQDQGYAFANVIRNLEPIPGENRVNIEYSFEKGKMAYFGNIYVKGNSQTRDKVIRRELKINEGQKYSGSGLRLSKEAVERLGFFEPNSVVINTVTREDRDDVLDLEIAVKERSTGQISLGAGYSTASKGFLQASIAKQNFRGLGQELKFSTTISTNRNDFTLGFTDPYLYDTKWTAGGEIFLSNDKYSDSYNLRRKGFDARIGYPIFDFTRLFLTYKLEDTELTATYNPAMDENLENGVASSISVVLVNDTRNNRMEPTKGSYLSGSYEFTGVGGAKEWRKMSLDGRLYHRVIGDLVFRSRVLSEKLFTVGDKQIPLTEKLYLGGSRDMRGYDYEAIGPKKLLQSKDDGEWRIYNLRGLFSFLSTVELEHPLAREAGLKWAVFADAGNVWSTYMGKDGNYDLKFDYGFGFRWFSPIGILRFEFAWPVGGDETGSQFHFDIGQIF